MEYLCKCLKCESVLIDKNPQSGATLHNADTLEVELKEMELICDIPGDTESTFWGCPVCKTDDNLIDM